MSSLQKLIDQRRAAQPVTGQLCHAVHAQANALTVVTSLDEKWVFPWHHLASAHFGRDPRAHRPLEGLRVLDIGCGGGLLTEPMARMGASVVGADASEKNIGIAKAHATGFGVEVDYRAVTAEALLSMTKPCGTEKAMPRRGCRKVLPRTKPSSGVSP